jgi:putative lipase involved disintegration of autophagic bodies
MNHSSWADVQREWNYTTDGVDKGFAADGVELKIFRPDSSATREPESRHGLREFQGNF